MDWDGGKQHNYALVTICFRSGDMEHYDEVIFSKPTFVNNDHIQLLNMMYSGVSNDPVDYRSQGGSPWEEYWHDGMNAVSIYNVKYLTTTEYEVLSKFNVATYLGAESEKKDWKGVSLAGTVDEISEMLRAEGDPEWMTNKDLRRRLFLKSQKQGGVPKICEVCEDSESNLHYYQEDGEQFVVCRDCLEQSMDDWKTIFGRRPNWNAEGNYPQRISGYLDDLRTYPQLQNFTDDELLEMGIGCLAKETYDREYPMNAETFEGNFSRSMSGGITYEVSFTSSLPMDVNYDFDDNLIQDYVEELIRDDGSRKGIQEFDFIMGSGWYSGSHINGTVTWWTGNYSAETFEADYSYGLGDYYEEDPDLWEHRDKYKIRQRVVEAILQMPTDKAWEYIIWIDSQDGAISEEENEAWETALANKDLEAALQNLIIERGYINEGWGTGIINELKDNNYYRAETFEAPSYGSYYGACLLPDGSCTETSLEMCRALGGNFQGPGTSCYPDAGWIRPRVMRADSGNQCGYDWKDGRGPCPDPAECTECGRCSECCQDHSGWECEYCDEEGWGDISMHTCPDPLKKQRKWYCSVCSADLKDRILYHNKVGDPDNMANYCQECGSPFCNEHWDGNLPVLCTVCSRVRNFSSESRSSGLSKGVTIGIVAGIISGLVTTVFGTVISEILLDRLREDPELEITDEDGTPPV